jgi:hypothetical protein
MAELVYLLCGLISVVCALMLLNGYRANRTALLFWSSLCFVGLAANNVLLFVDLVMTPPDVDLSLVRGSVALVAMLLLLYGLIWDSK